MTAPKVLIVDDEAGIAKLCERLLSRTGFQPVSFTAPREAMRYLETHLMDLLLVDIRMPEVDGFDLVSFAKTQQPDIAVLVMTGFGTVETAIRALRQGVDGLILKPFETGDELVQAVRQALEDNQRKRDAARIQAVRPLFDVTESLLAETNLNRLLEMIVRAVGGHLRCDHAAYYQYLQEEDALKKVEGMGEVFPETGTTPPSLVDYAFQSGVSLWVNAVGPGIPALQEQMKAMGLGSALCVPISQPNLRSVLYAARNQDEPPFREVDLDLMTILARQAAVALENAHLYEELREYVKRVEESQRALLQAEKMATVGRLTASIAHEINNPLQSVQNCLHLAGRDDLPEEKRKEYFNLSRVELDRLMTTVQRMLDFYRPAAASDPERVSLQEMLSHVLGLVAAQMRERGVEVQVSIPANLPKIRAVSAQLQQVFLNLILNAYDAMPEGGVLKISAHKRKDKVQISFQDSGSGIPMEYRASIFEPFVSTKEGGTGLGLTVSYNIVSAHGGVLEYVSTDEPGACFRVTLPIGG